MTTICVLDLETYYDREYSLSKISTEEYVRSPLFEAIGCAFKFDDGPTKWVVGPKLQGFIDAVDWSDVMVVCQNVAFDGSILSWRYGLKPLAWGDTMGMSRALFPHEKSHSLKSQAERAGVGVKGDEVIAALGKRLKDFTPDELKRYASYCINDVELTHSLFHRYMGMGFPKKELKLIDITTRMFTDPVLELDVPLLTTHLAEVRSRKLELLGKVRDDMLASGDPDATQIVFAGDGTEGVKSLLMSNPRFAQALERLGVEPPTKVSTTTGKITWAFAKTDEAFKELEEHPNEAVQALVAARLGNKTTLEETRTERMIGVASRGLLPVALRYFGAHTGRWSAEGGLQFQNLPRRSPIKNAIRAPEGYVLCGADLSNIELRLGLWLAGQDDRVDMLARGIDLYKDFAAAVFQTAYEEVTKDQRQVGKVANLSLIYGTGAAKLREALRIMGGVKMPVDQVKPIVDMYRTLYTEVVAAWRDCESAMHAIATDTHTTVLRGGLCTVEGKKGIRRPSGLYMHYPNLRRSYNADTNKDEWVFDSKHGLERLYGSKLFQGLTQSIARDIMGEGILRIQKRYPVRLTVHDSAYWLAPTAEAQEATDYGVACITQPVKYCPGLPLAAEAAFGETLADC